MRVRATVGIISILSLTAISFSNCTDINQAQASNASAVQITQLYAGAIFDAVIALGICISFYVLTRAGE